MPRAIHPAVWTRPTGEKVFRLCPYGCRGIEGDRSDEAFALLAEIWSSVFAEVGLRGEIVGEVSDVIGVTLVDVDADAPPAPTPLVPGFSALDREFAAFQDPAA